MSDFEYYEKDGKNYDRITHILDYFSPPGLVDWKIRVGKKEANRVSKVALKIGTQVDEAIKARILNNKPSNLKSLEAKNCFEGYLRWVKDYNVKHWVSQVVFDDIFMVAGTPDLETEDSNIDIKCAAEIRPQYWMQSEFYSRGLHKPFKAILRLDKNLGTYEFKKLPSNNYDWEATIAAIKLYRYYQSLSKDSKEDV